MHLKLLLIEDTPEHAQLVERAFASASEPVVITHVETIAEALQVMREQAPHLVLADLLLPDGSAIDFLSGFAGRPPWPVIVLTAQGDEKLAVATMKSGAVDYLVKSPATLKELPRLVQRSWREWQMLVEQHRMQEALRESEERFRRVFDQSPAGIGMFDSQRCLLRSNPALCALLGYSENELQGRCVADFTHPEDRTIGLSDLQLLVSGERETVWYQKRYIRKDGQVRWVDVNVGLLHGKDRGPLCFVVIMLDITEQRTAEQTLKEKSQRLYALFDEANDAIFVLDVKGYTVLEVNSSAERLLGYDKASLVGRPFETLFPPEAWERCARQFAQYSTGDLKVLLETEIHAAERRRVPVEISASVIALPEGRRVIQGLVRDISERHHLEAQLRHAQKMEAIGQLAGGVAHDFNNVLAAIMLQLGLLQADRRIPVDMQSTLSLLETSAKRASDLTRQLLLFGRRQPAKMQTVDVDVLVTQLLKMLRRLLGESTTLQFAARPNTHWVYADPGMLEQVVMNLVVNARDAILSNGRITIEIERVQEKPAEIAGGTGAQMEDYIRLSIADNGTGIDADAMKRLFEPFFTTKEQGKGTGLGLATVYTICKQHQGFVRVESELGRGSTFRVYLPRHAAGRSAPAAMEVPGQTQRGSELVLLVEDDTIVRTFTGLSLRAAGYRVLEAANGPEARERFREQPNQIRLLLSDMVMPEGMSGWELACELRRSHPQLGVVLMSGYNAEMTPQLSSTAERVVYLQKPFDTVKLTAALRSALAAPKV